MALVDHFIPLLASVREFQTAPRDDAEQLAARIDALLERARRSASDDRVAPDDFAAALFPVVAWIDEALLSLDWDGAAQWPRRLLQKRHFNLSTAGVEFFKRLDALPGGASELKEVYLLCLGLGFRGRYAYDRDPKALAGIRQQLLSSFGPGVASARDLLIPEGYQGTAPASDGEAGKRRRWRFSSLSTAAFALPLATLLLLYGVYHLIINHMATAIIQQFQ